MALNLASPGIVVREVDLTIGRVDATSGSIGALVAPFSKGPVEEPQLIESEEDLLQTFGQPYSAGKHYEHWMVASSFLAYGGTLQVVRADGAELNNASDRANKDVKIKSGTHYNQLQYDENEIDGVTFVAKTPGSYANDILVSVVDGKADQILTGINTSQQTTFTQQDAVSGNIGITTNKITGITTNGLALNQATNAVDNVIGIGLTITQINVDEVILSGNSTNTVAQTGVIFQFGTTATVGTALTVGNAFEIAVGAGKSIFADTSKGTVETLDGTFRGIITEIGKDQVSVKISSHVSAAGTISDANYDGGSTYALTESGTLTIKNGNVTVGTASYTNEKDWFEQQDIILPTKDSQGNFNKIGWDQLAERPSTTAFAEARGGRFDEVHVVVVDGKGAITGNAGTVLEKHLGLSKAKDAEFSVGSPSHWRKFLENNSQYIYGSEAPPTGAGTTSIGFSTASVFEPSTNNSEWNKDAANEIFAGSGVYTKSLVNGENYDGLEDYTNDGALSPGSGPIISGLNLFENTEETEVDFILQGSSNYGDNLGSAVVANKCVQVAEARKDAVAFVTPDRGSFISDSSSGTVDVKDIDTVTNNVKDFASQITSSSYAVIDSGYKYMFDRFNNTFRYVPLNGDIAGSCARTDIEQFPWFSPAGTSRGAILNAVKLLYNPGQKQRDILYSNRVNPVIQSPGAGIVLFGDKTAFGKSSAFDRINVRRLFIFLEDAISAAAKDLLFEFNDELTRTNFVNIVEPFLREVQSNRGIFDFVVICDETNNTAAIIDNNEFVADIFIKPARSINFIGLTFVATRTGVAFEEVIGSV